MAVTYSTAVKNTRLDAVTTAIDAGTGSPSAGSLQIGTAGMASVLAVIDFNSPTAAPAAAGGVLTFSMPQSDTEANATGTAAEAIIVDSDGTTVVSGLTVGTAATDIILDSTSITAGQTVTINSATITHG
jgi:hypothetical protein